MFLTSVSNSWSQMRCGSVCTPFSSIHVTYIALHTKFVKCHLAVVALAKSYCILCESGFGLHQVLSTRDIAGFPELMSVMVMLAGTWHGSGHVILFRAAVEWLGMCKKELSAVAEVKPGDGTEVESSVSSLGHRQSLLDATCCLLSYISDMLTALKRVGATDGRLMDLALVTETDAQTGDVADSDGVDELVQDDDDSAAEDSVCCLLVSFCFSFFPLPLALVHS